VTNNLRNKVKGKILVAEQIKQNVFKNRHTNTICNYQQFGTDHPENQFLKLVLRHVQCYSEENPRLFNGFTNQLAQSIIYCIPAFESVQTAQDHIKTVPVRRSTFYPEYLKAIELGEAILRRLAFNVTKKSTSTFVQTPPFWIDMTKLFELYVFGKLKKLFPNPGIVTYHDLFNQKETDILIRETDEQYRCVIDCKYKPRYEKGSVDLSDKRQILGYTRLKSVYHELGYKNDYSKVVKGLIIYSTSGPDTTINKNQLLSDPIKEYVDLYKLGIGLPVKNNQ
jgi:5-methylcytosine-specific restriction enzyme subunit McrC